MIATFVAVLMIAMIINARYYIIDITSKYCIINTRYYMINTRYYIINANILHMPLQQIILIHAVINYLFHPELQAFISTSN